MSFLRNIFKRTDSLAAMRPVQSCITTISFPNTIEALRAMVVSNQPLGAGATDLETLLNFKPNHGAWWTTPRWITTGDVLWFYHTLSAKAKIARLRKQIKRAETDADLIAVLDRAAKLAEQYAGTIFACAEVAGPTEYVKAEGEIYHFKNPMFAPLARVICFKHPLSATRFEHVIKINRQGTITAVSGESFDRLKELIAEDNSLPDFVRLAHSGDIGFRKVDRTNWRTVSCLPETRFIHEAQIRAYFLDYLIDELKDLRTPRLEECQCMRSGQQTGVADYMIQIDGRWVPVEAKLNLLTERDISGQVAKYTHIDAFRPMKDTDKQTRQVADAAVCLVIDQAGIYLLADDVFVDCERGSRWLRARRSLSSLSLRFASCFVQG
jgi:hypothetical protein